jgi:hypothetical protein
MGVVIPALQVTQILWRLPLAALRMLLTKTRTNSPPALSPTSGMQ